jgi:phospholipid-translocating ATPase
MVISAAVAANLFNGLNTRVWTGWVFFAVFIGIVLIWAYTVRLPPLLYFSYSLSK